MAVSSNISCKIIELSWFTGVGYALALNESSKRQNFNLIYIPSCITTIINGLTILTVKMIVVITPPIKTELSFHHGSVFFDGNKEIHPKMYLFF